MTVLADCVTQMTKRLDRTKSASVATDGLILTGIQLVEGDQFFTGELQQLLIADTPDEAYNLCTKYSPSCNSPSGYISEVSVGSKVRSSEGMRSSSSSSFSLGSDSAARAAPSSFVYGAASMHGNSNLNSSRTIASNNHRANSHSIVTEGSAGRSRNMAELTGDIYGKLFRC